MSIPETKKPEQKNIEEKSNEENKDDNLSVSQLRKRFEQINKPLEIRKTSFKKPTSE